MGPIRALEELYTNDEAGWFLVETMLPLAQDPGQNKRPQRPEGVVRDDCVTEMHTLDTQHKSTRLLERLAPLAWITPAILLLSGWFISNSYPCPFHADLRASWNLATSLNPAVPRSWIEPYRHAAYALLVHAGMVGDYLDIGYLRAISLVASGVGLLSLVVLTKITIPVRYQVFSVLTVLSMEMHGVATVLEAPDVPAWTFGVLAVMLAASYMARAERPFLAFSVGLAAGVSYAFRQQAVLVVPPLALALALRPRRTWKNSTCAVSLFVLGWAIGSSPQTICATLATGDPFYSKHGDNISFASAFRDSDRYDSVADWAGPIQAYRPTATEIGRHWIKELVTIQTLFQLMGGVLAVVAAGPRRRPSTGLVLGVLLFVRAGTAVVWLDERTAILPDSLAHVLYASAVPFVVEWMYRRVRWLGYASAVVIAFPFLACVPRTIGWPLWDPPNHTLTMLSVGRYVAVGGAARFRKIYDGSIDQHWYCPGSGVFTKWARRGPPSSCKEGVVTLYQLGEGKDGEAGCREVVRFSAGDAVTILGEKPSQAQATSSCRGNR